MNLRSYLRGAGIAMIITALVLSFSGGNKSHAMTDDEIKLRAKALGMTDGSGVLADVYTEATAPPVEHAGEDISPVEVAAEVEEQIEETASEPEEKKEETATESEEKKEETASEPEEKKEETQKPEEKKEEAAKPEEKKKEETVKPEEKKEEAAKQEEKKEEAPKSGEVKEEAEAKPEEKKEETENIRSELTGEDKKKSELLADAVETEAESTPSVKETAQGFTVVHINSGSSSTAVASALEKAGVIPSALSFDAYLCARGYDRHIGSGEFRIPAGAGDEDIALILMRRK